MIFFIYNYSSKKRKIYVAIEANSDVEFVTGVINKNMMFSPICKHACQTLCSHLKVDFEHLLFQHLHMMAFEEFHAQMTV